jgi:hypothetical protein
MDINILICLTPSLLRVIRGYFFSMFHILDSSSDDVILNSLQTVAHGCLPLHAQLSSLKRHGASHIEVYCSDI